MLLLRLQAVCACARLSHGDACHVPACGPWIFLTAPGCLLQCRCRPGFRLKDDGKTCIDIDECSTTYPCSQKCINTLGSYKCLCIEGYKLKPDNPTSCKAVTGESQEQTQRQGCSSGNDVMLLALESITVLCKAR